MTKSEIFAIAEHADGRMTPIAHDVIACAKKLGDMTNARVRAITVGDETGALARGIAERTGVDVIEARTPGRALYNGEVYTRVIEKIVEERNPLYICTAHSSRGVDFAPGLAVRLKSACITSVNGIARDDDGEVLFSRPVHNGKFNTYVRPKATSAVITVQPGFFKPLNYKGAPGVVEMLEMGDAYSRIRNRGVKPSDVDSPDLAEANTIVAVGRGVGKQENLDQVFRFSRFLSNAVVAGSRPMIDMGWMAHRRQVGVTGASVSPDIYIACGISGSSQHIAGMHASGLVISINNDKNAAIFNVSDVCIVEDLLTFINAFAKVVREGPYFDNINEDLIKAKMNVIQGLIG